MKKILAAMLGIVLSSGCTYQVQPGDFSRKPMGHYGSYVEESIVKNANEFVWDLFTYKSDSNEEWTSFGAEAVAGIKFEGDCEDYAMTVADLLISQGVSKRHLALATLNSSKRAYTKMDHAVLIVSTSVGQLVVDNQRKGSTLPISEYSEYHWYSMRRMDSTVWNFVEVVRPEK